MRVRLNLGRRIGEVVEMDYPTAKVMIDDGRATDLRAEVAAAPSPVQTSAPEVTSAPQSRHPRRGSR